MITMTALVGCSAFDEGGGERHPETSAGEGSQAQGSEPSDTQASLVIGCVDETGWLALEDGRFAFRRTSGDIRLSSASDGWRCPAQDGSPSEGAFELECTHVGNDNKLSVRGTLPSLRFAIDAAVEFSSTGCQAGHTSPDPIAPPTDVPGATTLMDCSLGRQASQGRWSRKVHLTTGSFHVSTRLSRALTSSQVWFDVDLTGVECSKDSQRDRTNFECLDLQERPRLTGSRTAGVDEPWEWSFFNADGARTGGAQDMFLHSTCGD